jgi:hypothetical protein
MAMTSSARAGLLGFLLPSSGSHWRTVLVTFANIDGPE